MKLLKKLQGLEERVKGIYKAEELAEEYCLWIKQHPILGSDPNFDFNKWLDSMPVHLIPCFQEGIKQMFSFLR